MIKNFAALALSMLVCFSALGGADAAGADAAAADAAAAADSIDYDTKFGALTDKDKKRALKAVGREVNKVPPICNEPKFYDLYGKLGRFVGWRQKYAVMEDISKIRDQDSSCADVAKTGEYYLATRGSIFSLQPRITDDAAMHVQFKEVCEVRSTADKKPGKLKEVEAGDSYRICPSEVHAGSSYRRIGGLDYGIVAIPFKARSGDIFGDSTVGPYVGLSGDRFTFLFTIGLTRINVVEQELVALDGMDPDPLPDPDPTMVAAPLADVEGETAATIGFGIVWRLGENFQLGYIVGKDHLSGSVGERWKFQNKTWHSIAIGFTLVTSNR